MQNITKPKALKSAFASGVGALKNEIPNDTTGTYNASFEDGFPAITMQPLALGGTPPDGRDMNGVLNVTTDYNFQFQNGFLPTFEQSVSDLIGGYPQGSILWYKDANNNVKPVLSLIGNNTYNFNTDPSYIDGAKWKEIIEKTSGRNIGDIFYTMRNDTALNGAVECNGAPYNTTDFVGAQSIGALLEAGKVPYVSLGQYATLLETQGSVGVFGWDGEGTTTFRVPTLQDVFIECGEASELGDYVSAGLPNITATWCSDNRDGSSFHESATGAVTQSTKPNWSFAGGSAYSTSYKNTLDASDSSSVYGNSDTVQPETVRYRAMVQLANVSTDEALETCTSVLADVSRLRTHEVIEFQEPSSLNDYTWYRKYRDGWVEQGGVYNPAFTGTKTFAYPVEMADTNYTLTTGTGCPSVSGMHGKDYITAKTTTGFSFTSVSLAGSFTVSLFNWQVSGLSAN